MSNKIVLFKVMLFLLLLMSVSNSKAENTNAKTGVHEHNGAPRKRAEAPPKPDTSPTRFTVSFKAMNLLYRIYSKEKDLSWLKLGPAAQVSGLGAAGAVAIIPPILWSYFPQMCALAVNMGAGGGFGIAYVMTSDIGLPVGKVGLNPSKVAVSANFRSGYTPIRKVTRDPTRPEPFVAMALVTEADIKEFERMIKEQETYDLLYKDKKKAWDQADIKYITEYYKQMRDSIRYVPIPIPKFLYSRAGFSADKAKEIEDNTLYAVIGNPVSTKMPALDILVEAFLKIPSTKEVLSMGKCPMIKADKEPGRAENSPK